MPRHLVVCPLPPIPFTLKSPSLGFEALRDIPSGEHQICRGKCRFLLASTRSSHSARKRRIDVDIRSKRRDEVEVDRSTPKKQQRDADYF